MSSFKVLNKVLLKSFPWVVTCIALYYAFYGVDWQALLAHIGEARVAWLALAALLTVLSYVTRSGRWQYLFPEKTLNFINAAQVLFLGFFMNNILPARAGEFVRAHMGSRLSGVTRTLVLATIVSERLVDGLTISFMFALFALGIGDPTLSQNLLYVAWLFVLVGMAVLFVLAFKDNLFRAAEKVHRKFDNSTSRYAFDRIQIFINGLSPLSSLKRLSAIAAWSILVWGIELGVYVAIAQAFSAHLSLPQCVLFLVAVNFSSLIPAAPGGIGVIEAITAAVLVSIGIDKEHALTMVLSQHVIQYVVVGIPGAAIMFNWKKILRQLKNDQGE